MFRAIAIFILAFAFPIISFANMQEVYTKAQELYYEAEIDEEKAHDLVAYLKRVQDETDEATLNKEPEFWLRLAYAKANALGETEDLQELINALIDMKKHFDKVYTASLSDPQSRIHKIAALQKERLDFILTTPINTGGMATEEIIEQLVSSIDYIDDERLRKFAPSLTSSGVELREEILRLCAESPEIEAKIKELALLDDYNLDFALLRDFESITINGLNEDGKIEYTITYSGGTAIGEL